MQLTTLRTLPPACFLLALSWGCGGGNSGPQVGEQAPGADRTATTAALETGADVVQSKAPVDRISMYLVGFHPSKQDPSMQMESHHYCDQVNEEFAQCVLFDGNTDNARLHGIEYIISAGLYDTLPANERPYWHPHNYEILSGQLRLPGLPDALEGEALEGKMNSYGKTWHVWKTGVHGQPADQLPIGPPHLAWSFNYDGEANEEMVADRDRRMEFDTAGTRTDRAGLATLAQPQAGVDALRGKLPSAAGTVNGVEDSGDTAAFEVPDFGPSGQN